MWELPPVAASSDPPDRREEALLSIVPRDPRKPYDMRAILEAVFDRGSVFELGARHGRSLICALARLDGRPVGVLASDPKHYGGGLTGDASDKLVRFVDLCDQFRLPVVNLVDQPGFVIGTEAERAGTMRRGARALFAVHQATRAVGARCWCARSTASRAPSHGDASRLNLRYAWPSGDWGSLPIAGGLEAAYRRELEAAEDPVALRAEIEARLDAVRSPFRTAERFGVEEIIDPRDTRPLLCAWARRAHELVAHEAGGGPKARGPAPLSARYRGPMSSTLPRRRRRRQPRRTQARHDAGEIQLIDVREDYEREAGRIAGARHIELERVAVAGADDRQGPPRRLLLPPRRPLGDGRQRVPPRRLGGLLAGRRDRGVGPTPACRSSPRTGMSRITRALLALVLPALLAPAGAAAAPGFVRVGDFDQPIHVASPPNDRERLFVVQRAGMVRVVRNGTPARRAVPRPHRRGPLHRGRARAALDRLPARLRDAPASSTST